MSIYPVYIPTLNRYEHFKNCVESLARCTHADKTELVVGFDYPPNEKYVEGWKKIKAYLPTLHSLGFGKVTVIEQVKNVGTSGNIAALRDYCFSAYDAAIGTEDDNVFSPNFLDFMNQALATYRNDSFVKSVSGYTQQSIYNKVNGSVYLSKDACGWGQGEWRNTTMQYLDLCSLVDWPRCLLKKPWFVLKFLFTYPIGFVMFWGMVQKGLKYGDLCRTAYNFAYGTYQLRPTMSLVRNCGQDGSGLHCCVNEAAARQKISDAKTFDFGDKPPRVSHKGLFWQGWEGTRYAKFMPWIKK